MKTVIVNGQAHLGSTRMTARELAEKVGWETAEFFLPRDFGEFCTGCGTCFSTDMARCPHYEKLRPIADAMDGADLIILASPVYVFHATGQMKAFLDHFGTRWIVHRPDERMFKKQAVCIATAAGGGMKSTIRDMADSLTFWGVPRIYRLGIGVRAIKPDEIPDKISAKIHKRTDAAAKRIIAGAGKKHAGMKGRMWFYLMRFAHKHFGRVEPDWTYWEEKGWHGKKRPWE